MQRTIISKFRPILLSDMGKWGAVSPMITRSFQPTPIPMQKGGIGPGKLTPKMAKLQQQYQVDDGKPVFLKGGRMDGILYRLTLVLCVVGTVYDLVFFAGYIIP